MLREDIVLTLLHARVFGHDVFLPNTSAHFIYFSVFIMYYSLVGFNIFYCLLVIIKGSGYKFSQR